MPLLSVEHVTKRYGETVAVHDASFEAVPGRILGLLGPNGAGKSSTLRMITHIMAPDRGQICYDGRPVGPWSQQRMGYLPEERGLYEELSVQAQLVYLAQLKGVPRTTAAERAKMWLDRFDLTDWADKEAEELSKGMQQKVQFIATLLHEPSLLIFDEPFSGLDPINADLLREIIIELKQENRTILFASHRMEQIEQLCDDICLISGGEIALKGGLREIKRSFGERTARLAFDGDDAFLDRLADEGRIRIGTRSLHRAEVHLTDGTTGRDVLEAALSSVREISRFELVEPPLNDIFVRTVGEHRLRNGRAEEGKKVGR